MSPLYRTFAALALGLAFAVASADKVYMTVSSFPAVSVADGRSTVTVSAEIRDGSGKIVPDGTRVFFTATLGNFRESVVQTVGGVARGTLVAGSIAGVSKITVTGVGIDATPVTAEYEFVGDRSELSTAQEYIEVFAPGYMQFTPDTHIIGAAAPDRGVTVQYRDTVIEADDVQISVDTHEVRARNARMRVGKVTREYTELYYRLNLRKGQGLTTYRAQSWDTMVATTHWIAFGKTNYDGTVSNPKEEERFGLVNIERGNVTPALSAAASSVFQFEDLSMSPSSISARKAVIFPRREVQFHRAEIYVAGQSVLKLPLHQIKLNRRGPLVTDDFVSINNNQLSVNYPYYLSLQPGQTSMLRLRSGGRGDRGSIGSQGVFLDYEMNWNRGDEMRGAFRVNGIARNDWIASVKQYLRLDDRTDVDAHVEMPGGKSVFGAASINRQFEGYQASLSANANRALDGRDYSRESVSFVVEKDPTKLGKLPVRLYYGLTAEDSRYRNSFIQDHQSTYGLRMRAQSLPIMLGSDTTLTGGLSVSRLFGTALSDGTVIMGTTALGHRVNDRTSVLATYDFTRDGFNDAFTGKHQLSLQGFYSDGKTDLSFLSSRALDVDRTSIFGDASYRFSDTWRLTSSYTMDRYFGDTFVDYSFTLGYRLGWREVGLVWSKRTNRIGVQLLGANF